MKLCSFEKDGQVRYGVEASDGTVIDLVEALGAGAPASLELLIEQAESDPGLLDRVSSIAAGGGGFPADGLDWRPPVRRPGKILGVAINNRIGQQVAYRPLENPAFFLKPATSLVGHGQPVTVMASHSVVHPEPELAVIIGKGGKNIARQDARSHIFGYSIVNDITSPGLKANDSLELLVPEGVSASYAGDLTWRNVMNEKHARSIYLTYHAISKGADGYGPFGPWIVTADDIANPDALQVLAYEDDELVFEDSTANLVFPVEHIISHISRYMTLEAGDVIHCGTAMKAVAGGKYHMPSEWDLAKNPGTMKIEIKGIGALINPVRIQEE